MGLLALSGATSPAYAPYLPNDSESHPSAINGLVAAGFIGGSDFDYAYSTAVDSQGNMIVAGHTYSKDLTTTPGALDTTFDGPSDGFIVKTSADGRQLLFSTFLGGSADDRIEDVAVGGSGAIYVTGTTFSKDFPTTPGAFDTTLGGAQDGFVAALSPDGSSLVFSTLLGGSNIDNMFSIYPLENASTGVPAIYVGGRTQSADFPTMPGANDTTLNGSSDGVAVMLGPDGKALYLSTYLGGAGFDAVREIMPGPLDDPLVTGFTNSSDFPVTPGAFDPVFGGGYEGYFARLDSGGPALKYSTFIGGSLPDEANSLAWDGGSNVYVVGETSSKDFPFSTNALDATLDGPTDAFLVALDLAPSTPRLRHSTYIGGATEDNALDVACLPGACAGSVRITGVTDSADFPVTQGSFDATHNGRRDAFFLQVSLEPRAIYYSTFIGGPEDDSAISLSNTGSIETVLVGGYTASPSFPVTLGSADDTYNAKGDAFFFLLEPMIGSERHVTSTSPSGLQGGVALDAPVTVKFNLPMDPVSTIAAFSIDPPVAGGSLDYRGVTLNFTHAGTFDPATTYRVAIASSAMSDDRNLALDSFEFRFSTAPRPLAPRVMETSPVDGAAGVALDAPLVIRFSEEMSPDAGRAVRLEPAVDGQTTEVAGPVVRIDHSSPFQPGVWYRVTVERNATSRAGAAMTGDVSFEFTTAPGDPQNGSVSPSVIAGAGLVILVGVLSLAWLALRHDRKKKLGKREVR